LYDCMLIGSFDLANQTCHQPIYAYKLLHYYLISSTAGKTPA